MWRSLLDTLPRGHTLDEHDFRRRHRLLLWLLALHVPGLAGFGLVNGHAPTTVALVLAGPVVCIVLGRLLVARRRTAAVTVTGGLVYCSGALVGLTGGSIEAHFHFFIIIGFIALYQDWAPFLFNVAFTVVSHGIGSVWEQNLIFAHPAGQANPWLWSAIHGVAVLFACVGMTLFWRITEESQQEKNALAQRLADAEIGRRQFTSDLLVNLARRNQSMLYRQLDIINQLEESERDPDALANLFALDHLATRVRRNAESLLVLSGEQPPRVWSEPVPLRDVVRAAIAETEDLDRVVFVVDERPAVVGHAVTDLTHLLAELVENAVRFSPPDSVVTIRARLDPRAAGGHLLTVEDWGVGMPAEDLAAANALLAAPPEVDLSVAQRLGFHVVARLAARHRIAVSLSTTPGSGVTAVVVLPVELFEAARPAAVPPSAPGRTAGSAAPGRPVVPNGTLVAERLAPAAEPPPVGVLPGHDGRPAASDARTVPWSGWWEPGENGGNSNGNGTPCDATAPPRMPGAAGPDPAGTPLRDAAAATPATGIPVPDTAARDTATGRPPSAADDVPGPVAPSTTDETADRIAANGGAVNGGAVNGGAVNGGAVNGGAATAGPDPAEPGYAAAAGRPAIPPARGPQPGAPVRPPSPREPVTPDRGFAVPEPRRHPGDGARAAEPDPVLGLRRRVPQASLAPELRRPAGPEREVALPAGHAADAATALSRYQASRQAAQAAVDGEGR